MIGVFITCGYYFGVVHDSDVYDDLSLIRLNEPWSMDLVCRGGRNIKRASMGRVNYCRKSLAKAIFGVGLYISDPI